MSVPLFDLSVPPMIRMLRNLSTFLEKGAAHVRAEGGDPEALVQAKLAPDMYTLARQVQSASDAAKAGAARLAGLQPPSMADTEATLAELQERIARTIAFLETITPDQVNGAEDRTITVPMRSGPLAFTGVAYLTKFVQPNFFFHVTAAYAILRNQGAPLGKMDFLGAP